MKKQLPKVVIYTDGGCSPNPGPGGWAALLLQDGTVRELSGSETETTNNRMELMAALNALLALSQPSQVTLYTDSTYLKRGITEWLPGWIKRNWRTTSGKVANQDLWQALLKAIENHQVEWRWVQGHAGNLYNQRVDWLAKKARRLRLR